MLLVVLAGVLVGWALSRAADRVQVVSVAQPIRAGEVIDMEDLTVTGIAFDGTVTGLVPDTSLDALVGKVAAVDLEAGALVQVGMWRDGAEVAPGERTIGAVLAAGPLGIMQACLDVVLPYVRERRQFGRPVGCSCASGRLAGSRPNADTASACGA